MSSLSFFREHKLLLSIAFAKFLLHVAINLGGAYGYFRDELYYIACSNHLAWGYVDQPPVSIFLLAISRILFGDSLVMLRILPAVAGSITVLFVGLIAEKMGGRKFAQATAAIAALASFVWLGMDSYYSMNAIDILIWSISFYLICVIINGGRPRNFILLGVVLGIGLMNKIDVLWLGLGIAAGLVLTEQRRWLRTRWPWICGAIALAMFLPFVVWNIANGNPHLEFMRNATSQKYSTLNALSFAKDQLLEQNPAALPLWLAGLVSLFTPRGAKYRLLGIIYVTGFAVLIANGHSKGEYLSPAYGALFAAGAVTVEQWTERNALRWIRFALPGVIGVFAIVFLPLILAVLPVESYIRYAEAIGFAPDNPEHKKLDKLPQFYADRFGWQEKTEMVARAYMSLPGSDRARCAIYSDNYGRCAAIDFFGKKYHLPPAIGSHNNYWLWGYDGYDGSVVIILGGKLQDQQSAFDSVEVFGVVSSPYCMPYENDLAVYVCRGLRKPLRDLWPALKHYE